MSIPVDILNGLLEIIENVKQCASIGKKLFNNDSSAFHLYQSELFNATNNVFYMESDELKLVSWTFCDPDYIISYDERLCKRASSWIQNLIKQSNGISKHSLKARNEYFNLLEDRVKKKLKDIVQKQSFDKD